MELDFTKEIVAGRPGPKSSAQTPAKPEDRKKGSLKGIEPDSKSQITMCYENDKPIKVTSVVISTRV